MSPRRLEKVLLLLLFLCVGCGSGRPQREQYKPWTPPVGPARAVEPIDTRDAWTLLRDAQAELPPHGLPSAEARKTLRKATAAFDELPLESSGADTRVARAVIATRGYPFQLYGGSKHRSGCLDSIENARKLFAAYDYVARVDGLTESEWTDYTHALVFISFMAEAVGRGPLATDYRTSARAIAAEHLDPESRDPDVRSAIALALAANRELASAEPHVRRALELSEPSADALYASAAYLWMHRDESTRIPALRALRAAAKAGPDFFKYSGQELLWNPPQRPGAKTAGVSPDTLKLAAGVAAFLLYIISDSDADAASEPPQAMTCLTHGGTYPTSSVQCDVCFGPLTPK